MPPKTNNRRRSYGLRKIKVAGQFALFGSLLESSTTGDKSRLEAVVEIRPQLPKKRERLPSRKKPLKEVELPVDVNIPDFERIQNYKLCVEQNELPKPVEGSSSSSELHSFGVCPSDISFRPTAIPNGLGLTEQTSTPYNNSRRLPTVTERYGQSVPRINLSPVPAEFPEEDNQDGHECCVRPNNLAEDLAADSPSILYRIGPMGRRKSKPDANVPDDNEESDSLPLQSVSDERLEMQSSQNPSAIPGSCVRVLRSRTIFRRNITAEPPSNIHTPDSRSGISSVESVAVATSVLPSLSMAAISETNCDVDMSVQMIEDLHINDAIQTNEVAVVEDSAIQTDQMSGMQHRTTDMSVVDENSDEFEEELETNDVYPTEEKESAVHMISTSRVEMSVDSSALMSLDNKPTVNKGESRSKQYTPQFKMLTKLNSFMGGSYLNSPIKEVYSPHRLALNARVRLMEQCQQTAPITFADCIPDSLMNNIVKIGEGVYGEVFRASLPGKDTTVYKIIPIEGDFKVNDEVQKTFEGILPEIVIARELSLLREGDNNRTPNYCDVRKVSCVKGAYPKELMAAWDEFSESGRSQNDRPDVFDENQLFIVFEFADGGTDLESAKLKSVAEAESIVRQVAISLYIAEIELHFEHRDLHYGNILIKPTEFRHIEYVLNGISLSVPSCGFQVFLIDFTLSRIQKDDMEIYTDLADDDLLFQGQGDYQFDIYRLMKECNENCWDSYEPYTNILWLHYLVDKLLTTKTYCGKKLTKKLGVNLRKIYDSILSYKCGAGEFVEGDVFFDEIHSQCTHIGNT